jgi:hypothetical protein
LSVNPLGPIKARCEDHHLPPDQKRARSVSGRRCPALRLRPSAPVVFAHHAAGVLVVLFFNLLLGEVCERVARAGHRLARGVDDDSTAPVFSNATEVIVEHVEIFRKPGRSAWRSRRGQPGMLRFSDVIEGGVRRQPIPLHAAQNLLSCKVVKG